MNGKNLALNVNFKRSISKYGTLMGLVIIVLIAAVATGGASLSSTNIQNLLRQVTVLGFASLGMTVVILTGNIDLSIIGNVSMTTVLTAVLMQREWPIWAIVLVVLLSGAFIGLCNGLILSLWKIESFVVTMGMQVVCFGLALLFSDSRTVIVDGELLMGKYLLFKNLATSKLMGIPIMFIILIVFYLIFYFLSKKTKLGRYIFALGGSEEVCYISGINVSFVRIMAYVISGACAALAGISMYSRSLCGDPNAGQALGMFVVAAVVVGGTKMSGGRGSILYTIIGIFIIQIINNTMNLLGAPYQIQQVIQGIIILIAVIISSSRRRT